MITFKKTCAICQLVGIGLLAISGCMPSDRSGEVDQIEIGKKYRIHSAVLDEEREYWVYLPRDYQDSVYAPYDYPVLYLLDGDRHFHSLTGIHQFLSHGPYASVPEMIIVGILNTDRPRDFTPTYHNDPTQGKRHSFPSSGGNQSFMEFLQKELMPEIASSYRTNGYEVLVGHSFGGLTALHTLLTYPDLFNAYIAIDPSVWWDDNYVFNMASQQLDSMDLSGKTLYMAHANKIPIPQDTSTEHERAIWAFKEVLGKSKNGLRWGYRFYEDEDHGTVSLPAEYDGLRFIYEGFQSEVKMVADDPQLIVTNYQRLSKQLGFEMKPAESLVDWIAGYSKRIGNKGKADELLRINAENHPHSPHAVEMANGQ